MNVKFVLSIPRKLEACVELNTVVERYLLPIRYLKTEITECLIALEDI